MKSTTSLPSEEIEFLQALPHHQRDSRLAILHEAGWSLSVLSRGLDKPKTTVHFWVRNAQKDPVLARRPVPKPPLPITQTLQAGQSLKIRTISPKVPPDLRPKIRELSIHSRRYRAKTPKDSPMAQANRELTRLAVSLHSQGVPTADIAEAAGVTYRAMARRIALGEKNGIK